jgi:ketosteroid isomerase-like protein
MIALWRILLAALTISAAFAQAEGGQSAIERMLGQYARSINGADTALAAQIWSQEADVSFIHPLGRAEGFRKICEEVYTKLMGGLFSERRLTVEKPSIHVYGDAAWAEFTWTFNAKLRSNGSPVTSKGRETQIYRREKDGWRLVHVHYSALPEPAQR